jgi:hypothetical protein
MRNSVKAGINAAMLIILVNISGLFSNASASNLRDDVSIKGDFRYRHEMIEKGDNDARHRHRIRARIGVFGKANEMFDVGVQMVTGSDDPVSTNQTLDGSFSTKDLRLDLAYFNFQHEKIPGLKITAGKFKNPFYKPGKSELIWDSDWNPEGGVVSFNHSSQSFELNLIGSGLWIVERSSGNDSYLAAGQGVARLHFNEENSNMAFGAGFFNYVNTQGFEPFFDNEDTKGNSAADIEVDGDTILVYANDYELVELFAEFTHNFESVPVTIMADYISNTAADSLDAGWLIGIRVGKAKKAGSWEFRYNYRDVEKDAVVGIFADSDFRGGGTDARGHEIGGAYQLASKAVFQATYFVNEIGLEEASMVDFNRIQIDLQLKF